MDANVVGSTIARLRKSLSMTQAQLANELNVSAKTISKWENGLGFPEVLQFPKLAKLFGVTVDYFIGCCEEINENENNVFLDKTLNKVEEASKNSDISYEI